jgi:hypothetical protein
MLALEDSNPRNEAPLASGNIAHDTRHALAQTEKSARMFLAHGEKKLQASQACAQIHAL